MSVRTGDEDAEFETLGVDAVDLERYAEVILESGDVIVHDRDDEDAWIQSDLALELDSML